MAHSSEVLLPAGWKVYVSRTYPDKIYYFSELTGASSWEHPQSLSLSDNLITGQTTLQNLNSSMETFGNKNSKLKSRRYSSSNIYNKNCPVVGTNKRPDINLKNNPKNEVIKSNLKVTKQDYSSIPKVTLDSRTAIVTPVQKVLQVSSKTGKTLVLNNKIQTNESTHTTSETVSAATKRICLKRPRDTIQNPEKPKNIASPVKKKCEISQKGEKNDRKDVKNNEQKDPSSKSKRRKRARLRKASEKFKVAEKSEGAKICVNVIERPKTNMQTIQSSQSSVNSSVSFKITNTSSNINIIRNTTNTQNNEVTSICDIEMLDVSSDLNTELGIDNFCQPEAMSIDDPNSYYMVLDTNILISHLKKINELKDIPLEGCGPPHFYIPWTVVEELDGLKKNVNGNVSRNAMNAIKYLLAMISTKHPRFHAQLPEEAAESSEIYKQCNDNKILESCMCLAEKIPMTKVILLTNDQNLKLKSVICNVTVHSYESLMTSLKADIIIKEPSPTTGNKNSCTDSQIPNSNTCVSMIPETYKNENGISTAHQEKRKILTNLLDVNNCVQRAVDNIINEAKYLTKSFIEPFYLKEMTKAYDDIWKRFPNAIIPPYSLIEILESIKRYWSTVFSLVLSKSLKSDIELLTVKFSCSKGFFQNEDALSVLYSMETIALEIQLRCFDLNVPIQRLAELKCQCNELCQKNSTIKRNACDTIAPCVMPVFEFIWALVNHLCGMVMDFYSIPHTFSYSRPDVKPTKEQFSLLIASLFPSVHLIKRHMSCIFDSPKDDDFKNLHKSLLNFVPSLQIQANLPPCPEFTLNALKSFCLSAQSRGLLENGYKQLCDFHSKLSEALDAMMRKK